MIREDDRSPLQQNQLHRAVVAHDTFMSGWGPCKGAHSYCAWVPTAEADADKLFDWVSNRSEMRRVAWRDLSKYRPPESCAHFHIYVADVDHPSQGETK